MGRHRAHELVDAREPLPGAREHGVRRRREPGTSLRHYPPYSWPGGSQIVDYDGRLLAEASPGPGERIVVAPIDITAVRHERETRLGHDMLTHLRTEAYPVYARHQYPPVGHDPSEASYERNVEAIRQAKRDSKDDGTRR
jgi:hypothetical protein